MRRRVGIVAGACAALVLVGTAGAITWAQHENQPQVVGTWHEASDVPRTPVALTERQVRERTAPAATRKATVQPGPSPSATTASATGSATASASPSATPRTVLPEGASATGRQRVGRVLSVSKLLGYTGGAAHSETFSYPGASYVKVHFSRMMMLPGDYLTVSDRRGLESYRYDAPAPGAARAPRWAMSVTGDTAVLELHRAGGAPVPALPGDLGVTVDRVARGFSGTEQARQPESRVIAPGRTGREESVCGSDSSRDVVCYRSADPVAYTRSKAIARLLINGTELCTGWRISTGNRMLTNNHCFDNSDAAYDTEVWFNYQCARCGGYDVVKPTKVWGDRVLTTNRLYDYTLFTVDGFDRIRRFGALALDTRRPVRGQELYVPQHPAGEPARIAGALGDRAGTCEVVDNAYDGYAKDSDVSYYCDTEGGSSGSPVISRRTNQVVALHHFGGCPNSGVRADILYAKLKSYL